MIDDNAPRVSGTLKPCGARIAFRADFVSPDSARIAFRADHPILLGFGFRIDFVSPDYARWDWWNIIGIDGFAFRARFC